MDTTPTHHFRLSFGPIRGASGECRFNRIVEIVAQCQAKRIAEQRIIVDDNFVLQHAEAEPIAPSVATAAIAAVMKIALKAMFPSPNLFVIG